MYIHAKLQFILQNRTLAPYMCIRNWSQILREGYMQLDEQVDIFLSTIEEGQDIDLSVYKSSQFCEALRKRALEDMDEIFISINNFQLKDEIAKKRSIYKT